MIQTGVRVSELVGLRVGDIHLGIGPHIKVTGKGRKKRATPLTKETVATQRRWLTERRGNPDDPLFPTRPGRTAQPLQQSGYCSPNTPPPQRCELSNYLVLAHSP
jgi:site-specific recombinase XerC